MKYPGCLFLLLEILFIHRAFIFFIFSAFPVHSHTCSLLPSDLQQCVNHPFKASMWSCHLQFQIFCKYHMQIINCLRAEIAILVLSAEMCPQCIINKLVKPSDYRIYSSQTCRGNTIPHFTLKGSHLYAVRDSEP